MKIIELVGNGNRVKFEHYRSGELWYGIFEPVHGHGIGFSFPVPITDCGEAKFKAEDKALLFMRWIRKHLETIEQERESA